MVNKCMVEGILVSKEIKVRETSTGKRCMNFTISNRREYKENGKYKNNMIFCECWRESVIKFVTEKLEAGCRICIFGEFKVDTYQDESYHWHNKVFLGVNELYPVTYKKYTPDDEDLKDEDYNADVAQIDWGEGF